MLGLELGRSTSFFSNSGYLKTKIAFNNRTEGFSDELRVDTEVGYSLFEEGLWLSAHLRWLNALNNGDLDVTSMQGSIFANNIEYLLSGGEISYYITKNFGGTLGASFPITGSLFFDAPIYTAGFLFRL